MLRNSKRKTFPGSPQQASDNPGPRSGHRPPGRGCSFPSCPGLHLEEPPGRTHTSTRPATCSPELTKACGLTPAGTRGKVTGFIPENQAHGPSGSALLGSSGGHKTSATDLLLISQQKPPVHLLCPSRAREAGAERSPRHLPFFGLVPLQQALV